MAKAARSAKKDMTAPVPTKGLDGREGKEYTQPVTKKASRGGLYVRWKERLLGSAAEAGLR